MFGPEPFSGNDIGVEATSVVLVVVGELVTVGRPENSVETALGSTFGVGRTGIIYNIRGLYSK